MMPSNKLLFFVLVANWIDSMLNCLNKLHQNKQQNVFENQSITNLNFNRNIAEKIYFEPNT